jgi:hypothetical protein
MYHGTRWTYAKRLHSRPPKTLAFRDPKLSDSVRILQEAMG